MLTMIAIQSINGPVDISNLLFFGNIHNALILYLIQLIFLLLFFIVTNRIFFNDSLFTDILKINVSLLLGGFLLSFLLLSTESFIMLFLDLQSIENNNNFNPLYIFQGLIFSLLVSIKEEVIFRGFLLNELMKKYKKTLSLFISSLGFCLIHISLNGIVLFDLLTVFIIGILIGHLMLKTKNLWTAIGFHAGFDFFLFFLYGLHSDNLNSSPIWSGNINVTIGLHNFIDFVIITLITVLVIFNPFKIIRRGDLSLQ